MALAGYGPALLEAGGAPNPDVTVSVAGGGGDEFAAIDGGGNVWMTNFTSDTISRYGVEQLESDATITPSVVISSDGASLSGPSGLAFDAGGGLWVSNTGSGFLERFAPAQLSTSGAEAPEMSLTVADLGNGLAFSPVPEGLPLQAPEVPGPEPT